MVDKMSVLSRTRPLTEQKRADRAEMKAFRLDSKRAQKSRRNRASQLLLALTLVVTFVGAWLAVAGVLAGVGLVVVGLPAAVGTAVWCFRNWDY